MSDRLSESMSIAQKSDWTILYENKDLKGQVMEAQKKSQSLHLSKCEVKIFVLLIQIKMDKMLLEMQCLEVYNQKIVQRYGLIFNNQQDLLKQNINLSENLQRVQLENIKLKERELNCSTLIAQYNQMIQSQHDESDKLKDKLHKKNNQLRSIGNQLLLAREQLKLAQEHQQKTKVELETTIMNLQQEISKQNDLNSKQYLQVPNPIGLVDEMYNLKLEMQNLKDGQYLKVEDDINNCSELKKIINKLLKNLYNLRDKRKRSTYNQLAFQKVVFQDLLIEFLNRGQILKQINSFSHLNNRPIGKLNKKLKTSVILLIAIFRMKQHKKWKTYKKIVIVQSVFISAEENHKALMNALSHIEQMKDKEIINDLSLIKELVSQELNSHTQYLVQDLQSQKEQFQQINLSKDLIINEAQKLLDELQNKIRMINSELQEIHEENQQLKECQGFFVKQIKELRLSQHQINVNRLLINLNLDK